MKSMGTFLIVCAVFLLNDGCNAGPFGYPDRDIDVKFSNSKRNGATATYAAAVVEINPESITHTSDGVTKCTKQAIDIIESNDLNGVDIVVLPETFFNRPRTAVPLPDTKLSYCDDPTVNEVLRSVSCAVRKAKKYVVIGLYVKEKCQNKNDCANKADSTNLYNMAIVFDRNGDVVAKYRKYNLFNELRVQTTKTPDVITFETDFGVKFGVCICFDLLFDQPTGSLVDQGVKHFVYPTMWPSELPYMTAAQYQQSWAYANDVTLLAANVNIPDQKFSGSGIYHRRSGALQVVVNESPATKILIAKIPIDSSASSNRDETTDKNRVQTQPNLNADINLNGMNLNQDNLTDYKLQFLDFSRTPKAAGIIWHNDICCEYDIEVSDNGESEKKPLYSYAIAVFSGQRRYLGIKNLRTDQDVCSLIACKGNTWDSCGIRIPPSQVHDRYNFKKLSLKLGRTHKIPRMKVMPSTMTNDLLPLKATEFDFKIEDVDDNPWKMKLHVVELNLIVPKSNLLTFAIFSRNFDKDVLVNNAESHKSTPQKIQ